MSCVAIQSTSSIGLYLELVKGENHALNEPMVDYGTVQEPHSIIMDLALYLLHMTIVRERTWRKMSNLHCARSWLQDATSSRSSSGNLVLLLWGTLLTQHRVRFR